LLDKREDVRGKAVCCQSLGLAAECRCFTCVPWIAQLRALRLADGESATGALGDKPALLLGQRGVEVEHEGICIGSELGHDEGNALCHQAGDEGDIAGGDEDKIGGSMGRRGAP
jgi:hypothetical protein